MAALAWLSGAVAALAFLLAFLVSAPSRPPPLSGGRWLLASTVNDTQLAIGEFVLSWTAEPGQQRLTVHHRAKPAKLLWETVRGMPFLTAAYTDWTGTWEFRGTVHRREATRFCRFQSADRLRPVAAAVAAAEATVEAAAGGGRGALVRLEGTVANCESGVSRGLRYQLDFRAVGRQLSFRARLCAPHPQAGCATPLDSGNAHPTIVLSYFRGPGERLLGFGEQFLPYSVEAAGALPLLTQEQGVGRGRQPFSAAVDAAVGPVAGTVTDTYAPSGHYLTTANRSLLLTSGGYTLADLRSPGVISLTHNATAVAGRILVGDSPLDLVREFTSWAGRLPPLPEWALAGGAVVAIQGGSARVRDVIKGLRAGGVPLAAVWLQDWCGQRHLGGQKRLWWNWAVDRGRYPDWEALVKELAASGIKTLAYVNPYLVDNAGQPNATRFLYREALALGHLVSDGAGRPYEMEGFGFPAFQVDLSSLPARRWLKAVIATELLSTGVAGWMADFGEGLPLGANLAASESRTPAEALGGGDWPTRPLGNGSWAWHNLWPVEWARLNRELLEEKGLVGRAFFFMRAGFTRSPAYTTAMWVGDQTTTWDAHDGLGSVLPGMLSGGLSGLSVSHSDIGGYTSVRLFRRFTPIYRTRELFLRWCELAAFTPIYRTHEGMWPPGNTQHDASPEVTAHFAFFAAVHSSWAFLRRALAREATDAGHPIVRHLVLHYPADATAQGLQTQFLLGPDVLVAPVLHPCPRARGCPHRVYLPHGQWVALDWSPGTSANDSGRDSIIDSGGEWRAVAAPLGRPAVFFRDGSEVGRRFRREIRAVVDGRCGGKAPVSRAVTCGEGGGG